MYILMNYNKMIVVLFINCYFNIIEYIFFLDELIVEEWDYENE